MNDDPRRTVRPPRLATFDDAADRVPSARSSTTRADPASAGPRAGDPPAHSALEAGGQASGMGAGATGTTVVPRKPIGTPSVATTGAGLVDLAAGIDDAHREGCSRVSEGLPSFRRAGELLLRVKAGVPRGEFQAWVEEHCGFAYRTAAAYMRIAGNWPEVERMIAAKVPCDALSGLTSTLKALSKPRSGPDRGEGRPPEAAIDRAGTVGGEASGTARVLDSNPSATTTTELLPSAPPVDAVRPVALIGPRDETGGERRSVDGGYLARCPIWPKLKGLGNAADFEADAEMWRALRAIAEEILAGHPPDEPYDGIYACLVLDLARAGPPEGWILCPGCDGAGHAGPLHCGCRECSGSGYRFEA